MSADPERPPMRRRQEPEGRPALFLARDSYRARRVQDAARLLPVFALTLWLVPVFWTDDTSTGAGMIYLFSVWLMVICVSALLARRLLAPIRSLPGDEETDDAPDPRP